MPEEIRNCNNCNYLRRIKNGKTYYYGCDLANEHFILSKKYRRKGCDKWHG